jgi:sulfate-transporting ATPase
MIRFLVALVLSLPNIGAYAILAVGIVMIYRASKVLNLAHGAMTMIPPYVVYSLSKAGLPALPAVVLGIVAGGLLGWGVERVFVRPLRGESVTAQTVGTVAALGVLVALAAKVWGTTQLPAVRVFPEGRIAISQSSISYGELGLFFVMIVVTGALLVLFQRTDLGLLMRGTAENRRAASLMGVDPDRITGFAWILGGALAGLSGILLASVTNLHPYTLSLQALPAFVAALFAGLASLLGAVAGAGIVGAVAGIVPILGKLGELQGGSELFLALTAIVVMATKGGRLVAGDIRSEMSSAGGRREREHVKLPGGRPVVAVAVALFALFPFMPFMGRGGQGFAILGSLNKAAIFAVIATALVLLTGWVGQISLGHAALVGVGAYTTGMFAQALHIPFPLNLPLAALLAAGVATALGVVAVRVRGLYLAVATLIFSWMADAFLFRQDWLTRYFRIDEPNIGKPGTFPYFDFSDRRIFYFVAWAVAGLGLYAAANLRDSKTGRAFFAVRGSEVAASSLGIDVVRYKLLAFSISGFLAGAAGNLIMTESRAIVPGQFQFNISFLLLSIAVVGGTSSLGGGVAASVVFASLDYVFFKVRALGGLLDITSAALLAVVLLAYRGGLARAGSSIVAAIARQAWAVRALEGADRAWMQVRDDLAWLRSQIAARTSQRLVLAGLAMPAGASMYTPAVSSFAEDDDVPQLLAVAGGSVDVIERPRPLPAGRESRAIVLRADEVTVRFGGLVAVNGVTLEVREGEIVGLIGPNGAGKTVTFNSIAGIVTPTSGRVTLYDKDVTNVPVHERAQLGVARTFQAIQLVPQLSVFDNLLVATHLHNPTGFLSHVAVTPRALEEEHRARERVRGVVSLLGLKDAAERQVADLPFGVLRMVEVARAMVTGFKFIMLDEPASGLDNTETEKLTEVLLQVRDLGVTLLLIEHDVKMVTSVSDYIYVLERGTLIAEGPADKIKRDPAVVAAYLGEPVEA